MAWVAKTKILVLALVVAAVPATAYKIGSSVPLKRFPDLHESITEIAGKCRVGEERPANCLSRFNDALGRVRWRQRNNRNNDSYASRWPDDPTRMLDSNIIIKAGWGLQFEHCAKAIRRGRTIDRAGFMCSSHFGQLQFLHAQSRPEDRTEDSPENHRDPAITRSIILAWARFAYRAATDPSFRAQDYCGTVNDLEHESLRTALRFSSDRLCNDRASAGRRPSGRYRAWRVGTFFGLRCPGLRSFLKEWPCLDRAGYYDDARAELGARGAILHLIQDSYSQSHVARTPEGEPVPPPRGDPVRNDFSPRVVCRAPRAYHDYEQQNQRTDEDPRKDPHGVADYAPELHESCNDPLREVDDIITASAVAIYYLDRPDAEAFNTYLANCVFPDPAESARRRQLGRRCTDPA